MNMGTAQANRVVVILVLAFTLAVLLLAVGSAYAFTCTPTDCTFVVTYIEPLTLANGTPLTNLTSTTITYTKSVNGVATGAPTSIVVPASRPAGGGTIVRNVTDAALVPGNNYSISATVLATNPTGASASSQAGVLAIPRANELPPAFMLAPTLQ